MKKEEEEEVVEEYLEPSAELLVKKETRELGGAGPLQEFDEYLPEWALKLVGGFLEGLVPDEMGLVVVGLELLEECHELFLVEVLVDFGVEESLHLIEVSGVESRGEQSLIDDLFGSFFGVAAAAWPTGSSSGRHGSDHKLGCGGGGGG